MISAFTYQHVIITVSCKSKDSDMRASRMNVINVKEEQVSVHLEAYYEVRGFQLWVQKCIIQQKILDAWSMHHCSNAMHTIQGQLFMQNMFI